MHNFELELVKAFNNYFEQNKIDAIAYRRKQAKFSEQFCDILVDSRNPKFYLAVENKSINLNSSRKLYFSQHLHAKDRKQIEKISKFLKKSGRRGFLALEVREGKGKPKKAYLIPWNFIEEKFKAGKSGFNLEKLEKLKNIKKLERKSNYYIIRKFG